MLSAQDDPVTLKDGFIRPVAYKVVKSELINKTVRGRIPDIDPPSACRKQMSAVAVRQQILNQWFPVLKNCTGSQVLIFEVGEKARDIEIQRFRQLELRRGQNVLRAAVRAKRSARG